MIKQFPPSPHKTNPLPANRSLNHSTAHPAGKLPVPALRESQDRHSIYFGQGNNRLDRARQFLKRQAVGLTLIPLGLATIFGGIIAIDRSEKPTGKGPALPPPNTEVMAFDALAYAQNRMVPEISVPKHPGVAYQNPWAANPGSPEEKSFYRFKVGDGQKEVATSAKFSHAERYQFEEAIEAANKEKAVSPWEIFMMAQGTALFGVGAAIANRKSRAYEKASADGKNPSNGFTKPRISLERVVGRSKQLQQDIDSLIATMTVSDEKRKQLGVKPVRGAIFHGPPGTAKTTLAEAIANKTGRLYRKISATSLVPKNWVGTGVISVEREMNLVKKEAQSGQPILLHIDEIDALFIERKDASDEDAKTLNAFLTGIESLPDNVTVIYTTNHLKKLDSAAMRNGRVDRKIKVGLPATAEQRLEILKLYARSRALFEDVDLNAIAEDTSGYSGADLKALFEQAATEALMRDQTAITQEHLLAAKSTIDRERPKQGIGFLTGVEKPTTTFDDIGGQDEIIPKFRKIATHLSGYAKNKDALQKAKGRKIKPSLLVGSPGTGKTELGRATANGSKCNFISVSGSEFVEMFVGNGAKRVREMFELARENAPCIIFIDESDALFKTRSNNPNKSNDEAEQTLNQLLVEMDGIKSNDGVYVMAATNRPELFDKAALRRFRSVSVEKPQTALQRRQILDIHAKKYDFAPEVNLNVIAEDTLGYSGSELADLLQEAADLAEDAGRKKVMRHDITNAMDNLELGEKSIYPVSVKDQHIVGVHEIIGHGLLVMALKNRLNDFKIRAVTMEPRRSKDGGQVLGFVRSHWPEGIASTSIENYLGRILMSIGGRLSERVLLGKSKATAGGGNDYQTAESIVVKMLQTGMIRGFTPNQFAKSKEELSPQEQKLINYIIGQAETANEKIFRTLQQQSPGKIDELVKTGIAAKTLRNEEAEALYTNVLSPEDWAPLYKIVDDYIDSINDTLDDYANAQQQAFTKGTGKIRFLSPKLKNG